MLASYNASDPNYDVRYELMQFFSSLEKGRVLDPEHKSFLDLGCGSNSATEGYALS